MNGRTIGQLAREAGVNVETIRYYERIGLIKQPAAPQEGWRTYDDTTLRFEATRGATAPAPGSSHLPSSATSRPGSAS